MSEKYRTNPFYNGVSTFKSAFPELQDAQIEWRERRGSEDDKPSDVRRVGFRRGNFTQGVVPCSNPSCHEGGYQLDRLVADMLKLEEFQREGMMLCFGKEIGEEVRRGPIRCTYRIEFKAVLSQKTQEAADAPNREPGQNTNRNRGKFQRRGRGRGSRGKSVA